MQMPFIKTEKWKSLENDVFAPRLLRLIRTSKFERYGFYHGYNAKMGHYVDSVDANSIAAKAGMLKGDRIYEVNGEAVSELNTTKALGLLINEYATQTTVLVLCSLVAPLYAEYSIHIHGRMKGIVGVETPPESPPEPKCAFASHFLDFTARLEHETQKRNNEILLNNLAERVSGIESSTQQMVMLLKQILNKISDVQDTAAEKQERLNAEMQANLQEVAKHAELLSNVTDLLSKVDILGHSEATEDDPCPIDKY